MQLYLNHLSKKINTQLIITGSKSETNRLLLLQALYPEIAIDNKSNADDSVAMQSALVSSESTIDIHHAGTAMRFLTAYFSNKHSSDIVLTGSSRMQERPIGLLVEALRSMGAHIAYEKNEGFPPLRIQGQQITGGSVCLPANISSQYISALLLAAPKFTNGIELNLEGEITSLPYLKMTLSLLERVGIASRFEENKITILPHDTIETQTQVVESDWSSASYWFSAIALSDDGKIQLNNFREDSLQGDAVLMEIYRDLGVESHFEGTALILQKKPNFSPPSHLELDLIQAPDIAQTIAVSCYGLGISCTLTGLHTLKIKETDRLLALEKELGKLGAVLRVDQNSLYLESAQNFQANQAIDTYNDHRMAMAFAPLALKIPLKINHAEVVSKSYPSFWEDMQKSGFQVAEK